MSGSLFTTPRFRAVNVAGDPLAGARLSFYQAGTTVLAPVYTTSLLDVQHSNPIIADYQGEFRAIYLDPAAGYDYKAILTTAGGAQVWAEDNIPAGVSSTGGGGGGEQGLPGDPGLSVAELTIYVRSDTSPGTPSGGSFSFTTQLLTPPDGWSTEIPSGSAPVWASKAVAAVNGNTGTDDILDWSAPAQVFADGSSVDIVFQRSATQPPTPAPSPGVAAGWYTDVDSVPSSSNTLWSSVGTRAHAGENWVWQLPIQVEGNTGPAGPSASLYYIRPTAGTSLKNGTGTLRCEARQLFDGNDVLLSNGTVQLYVTSTLVTEANGYAAGSTGYVGYFDSGDIAGALTVLLRDGPTGTILDSITLVDVADGTADTGKNAVYGYIDASNGLAFTKDGSGTWSPAGATTRLDCTFVQGGSEVARVAWLITRDADGLLTGATTTHGSGDLNAGRVTVTEVNEGAAAMSVKFAYSFGGDTSLVTETVLTSVAGTGSVGATGPAGVDGYVLALAPMTLPVMAYANGTALSSSLAAAEAQATLWSGTTDVTSSTTFSVTTQNCTATINTADNTPVAGKPIGYIKVNSLSSTAGYVTVSAVHSGNTITNVISVPRISVGYEIVSSLPNTNLFVGRMVFLESDGKLYRYVSPGSWTRAVDGADLVANSVTANAIAAGTITAAKIATGTITSASGVIGDLAITNASIQNLTVGTEKFQAYAVTESFLFTASGTFMADTSAPTTGTWYDVNQAGLNARVTVTGIPTTGGARVVVAMNINAGSNGAADTVRYRVVRVEDSLAITPTAVQAYLPNTVGTLLAWNFIDSAPTATSHTYKLQTYRVSGNAGYLFDVQLLATLYKK